MSFSVVRKIFLSDNMKVGLDIQLIKPFNPKLAERLFPEKQIKVSGAEDFAKFWTMKEAAAKCVGIGLLKPEKRFLSDINKTCFMFCGEKIYYKHFVKGEYAVTACSYEKNSAEIFEITIKNLINC